MLDAEPAREYADAHEHLQDELTCLGVLILREVARFRAVHPEPPDGQGIYIGNAEVDRLLAEVLCPVPAAPHPAAAADEAELTRRAEVARSAIDARLAAGAGGQPELPLEHLSTRFGLTLFDRAALLLACAPDLDRRYETLIAYLLDDVTKRRPTTGLAIALWSTTARDRWQARRRLQPGSPLVDHGLLAVEDGLPFLSRALRVDDRVLDELLGHAALDARLRAVADLLSPVEQRWKLPLSASLGERLDAFARLWRVGQAYHPIALLEARRGDGAEAVACALAERLGRSVLRLGAGELQSAPAPAEVVAAVRREAVLRSALVVVQECQELFRPDTPPTEGRAALVALLREAPAPLVLVTPRAPDLQNALPELPLLPLVLPSPSVAERRRLWGEALEREGLRPDGADVGRVATTFVLAPGQIERAAAGAGQRASLRGAGRSVRTADLNAAARAESHHGLDALARRIDPLYTWDDIVLPRPTMRQVREIAAAAEHRSTVLVDWGLGRKLSRGRGLNILFSGASGTGKTMAAEVVARELGLDLFQIDLATVVSKYIGETEKNLKRIFDEAEASNVILFFDEADALFGKRSEVRDSHDRYANIEIAYLLQLMEQYESGGMAILATNLSANVDDAFARRMQYVVEFPLPDARLREQIWIRMFPAGAPVADEVDFGFLARQFELAGGSIRGAALGAATLAAADGGVIGMSHLTLAVARELQKLGRLPSHGEFGPWYAPVLEQLSGSQGPP